MARIGREERGRIALESGSASAIGSSDYAPFRRSGPLEDIGRGLMFNLAGGLLPQRSWFLTRHEAPVIALGGCTLLGTSDAVASLALLPIGRIHGFRDHAGQVDPRRRYETWALVLALFESLESESSP